MLIIGIFGIATVLLAVQFKTIKQEYGILLTMAGCVIIFFYSLSRLTDIIALMKKIVDGTSISYTYITTLLKITGITYVAEFSSDIAKDCGYAAIANQIQIFGKLTVLAISLPIFEKLIETIGGILS